jgi:4'-phosphopantetheinyl transferase
MYNAEALTSGTAFDGDTVSGATLQVRATAFSAPILWVASCDMGINPDWEAAQLCLLHESERQRYHGLLRPQRRRQFLLGRVLLRHALSDLFNGSPASWQIRERPGQAPRLASNTPSPVTFSLAHSRNRVACMLASGAMIGVDIEYTGRQRDFLCMAAHSFHPENVRQLQALQAGEQAAGFYRFWTLHEAALKACNGCDRVCSKDPYGCGWDPEPMFATAVVGEYSIALAVRGGVLPPQSIKQLYPEGHVEIHKDVDWDLHGVERFIPGGSFPAFFVPRS